MRILGLIAALGTAACASTGLEPAAGAVARIETGVALNEDLMVIGVGDSDSMNRTARTRVRNLRCTSPGPGLADCAYEATRAVGGADWTWRRRLFIRRDTVAPGQPAADGWTIDVAAPGSPGGLSG